MPDFITKEQFAKLESSVEALKSRTAATVKELQDRNKALEAQLKSRDSEILELKTTIETLEDSIREARLEDAETKLAVSSLDSGDLLQVDEFEPQGGR